MPLTPRRDAPKPAIDRGAIVVAAVALIAFIPALSGGFVWDDFDYVKNNPILKAAGLTLLRRLATDVVVGNYHPLTMASLAIDNALLGPGPAGFHAMNVIVHAANAVLLGYVLMALGWRKDASWAGALLWAVHPLRVESVAWISARKDLLYVFFFLAALLAYLRHARNDSGARRAYAGSLVLFCCSVLSKGAAVAFVPVMFLVDWRVGRRPAAKTIVEKLPFVAVAIVFGVIAVLAQNTAGAIPVSEEHSLAGRLVFACYGLLFYVVKTLAPLRLSAFYPYPASPPILAVCGVAAIAALLAILRKRIPVAVFAAGIYLATVALVLQLFPVGGAVAADRYAYLPGIAFSIVVAALLSAVPPRRGPAFAVIAVVVVLTSATWARCRVWHDSSALWNDVLSKYPDVPIAHQNRGVERAAQGDHRRAIADYDAAIAESPKFAMAWANRGASKSDLGDRDGAIADLQEAIRLDPSRATYRFDLGLTLGDKGRWNEALESLGEAIRLKPDFAAAYLNRGLALEQMGRAGDGAADVQRARELGYPVSPEVLRRFR